MTTGPCLKLDWVGIMHKIKKPEILKNVLDEKDFMGLESYAKQVKEHFPNYDLKFGRHQWGNTEELIFFHKKLLPIARKHFENDEILPTWSLLSAYEGNLAKLQKHTDNNACTFHLDLCVYQNEPWDLWVEGEPYTLYPNEALAMYGEDQEHWREDFPSPESNIVCNAFFFFAEPNHWFFTKGPSYLSVIKNQITEEEWEKTKGY